jgi:hypothetical protein
MRVRRLASPGGGRQTDVVFLPRRDLVRQTFYLKAALYRPEWRLPIASSIDFSAIKRSFHWRPMSSTHSLTLAFALSHWRRPAPSRAARVTPNATTLFEHPFLREHLFLRAMAALA